MALNRGWSYTEQVGVSSEGASVLDYLLSTQTHSSMEEWQARIDRGEIDVDGSHATASTLLRAGQTLVWHRPPWDEPEVPLHFDVIHEDDAIVAVNKPSGLPTMPAGGFLDHTLLTIVQKRYPGASPLHRLGRFTSGITLFARTAQAASIVAGAWRDHEVEKHYIALACGVAQQDRVEIDAPIGPVPHPTLGSVYAASPGGKPARSVAHVIKRRQERTLFGVEITTGRPHQIRIHLAWAGHPLAGDPLYGFGGVPKENPGLPGDGGYLLHAERLGFTHPVSRAWLELSAPVPAGLSEETPSV